MSSFVMFNVGHAGSKMPSIARTRGTAKVARWIHNTVKFEPAKPITPDELIARSGDLKFKRKRKPLPRFARRTLVVLGIGAATYGVDEVFFASVIQRSFRAIYVLGSIAADYKFKYDENHDVNALHEQTSSKLFNLLVANKGLYIKVGQAIAVQATMFPPVFQKKFALLFDNGPVDAWKDVDRTLKSELGKNYESQHFTKIERNPVASASIAQVHKGYLKNGDVVAIKVQHNYIPKQVNIDLFIYRSVMKFYEYMFEMPLTFATNYISDQLHLEVDFHSDFNNSHMLADAIKQHLSPAEASNYHVPETYDELCTSRVLVTEWIDGISLADKELLIKSGYNIKTVVEQYINIFAKQIFQFGFVHADPHPGNLLVRLNPVTKKQQLVVLDHGLYVKYSAKFRKEYCSFWKALFELDSQEIMKIGEKWGIGSVDMFASMTQLKPYSSKKDENEAPRDGQKDLGKAFKRDSRSTDMMKNFLKNTDHFPLELIFVGRAMRMLQSLNQKFGSPVNRVRILAKEAIKNYDRINTIEVNATSGVFGRVSWRLNSVSKSLILNLIVFFNDVLFTWVRFVQIVTGNRYNNKGVEDMFEKVMIDSAKEYGFEIAEGTVFEG